MNNSREVWFQIWLMREQLVYFGSFPIKGLLNWIQLVREVRLGNCCCRKRDIERLIMFAKLRRKTFPMWPGYMQIIFFHKDNMKNQPSYLLIQLEHSNRSF